MSKGHAPGPDWTCTCGYDYFGGSAAYSWQLYEEHVQSVERDRAEAVCHGDGEQHCCCNEPCDIPPEGGDRDQA